GVADAEGIYKIAQAFAALNDRQTALRLLRRAVEGGFFCYPYFTNDPLLNNLRGEAEFARLMELARRRHEEFKRRSSASGERGDSKKKTGKRRFPRKTGNGARPLFTTASSDERRRIPGGLRCVGVFRLRPPTARRRRSTSRVLLRSRSRSFPAATA